MRKLIVLALLTTLGCVARGPADYTPLPETPVQPLAGLPAISGLDRLASVLVGDAYTDEYEVILRSPSVVEQTETPSRWWITCGESGDPQWVIARISGLEPSDGNLRYLLGSADTSHELSGTVFCGVSDFARGSWRWRDVSMIGWFEPYFDSHFVGIEIPPDCQPVSPDGGLYLAVVAVGAFADASATRRGRVYWEFDEPFLAPPDVEWNGGIDFSISGGPDSDYRLCSGVAVYWRPLDQEEFLPTDRIWTEVIDALPTDWSDVDHSTGVWAAALISNNLRIGQFTEEFVRGEE